jgi:hypothetical protein
MKNKIIIAVVIVVILVGVGIYGYMTSFGPRIVSFYVAKPALVVEGDRLSKVEVYGVPPKGDNILMGTMELVEESNGAQTWTLTIPDKAVDLKEIFARGYAGGRTTNKKSLPIKSSEIKNELWAKEAQVVLNGTVKSISGRTILLNISLPVPTTMNIRLDLKGTIVDAKGKPTTLAQLKPGTPISVTGDYTDETAFTATQIELTK